MYILYEESPIGLIQIKATEKDVVSVRITEGRDCVDYTNHLTRACGKQLKEYFLQERKEFELPLKLEGTAFQEKVWRELAKIPYGATVSYKEIAKNIGNEKAVRAVGTAIGKNPIAIIVPCHRVIAQNGEMGGYAYGISIKQKLLNLEKKNINFKNV